MTYTEHGFEPVPGLPGRLPAGERVLWRGAPRWGSLFRHACYLRVLGAYFALLLVWQGIAAVYDGRGLAGAVGPALWIAVLWAALMALLAGYCWLVGRTTVYTITNRRLVMRIGVALPITLNLPFRAIERAGVTLFAGGTGDIVMAIKPGDRVAFLVLWPHTRPWRLARPQPMLRSVPDAKRVAELLGGALAAWESAEGIEAAAPAPDAVRPRTRDTVRPRTHDTVRPRIADTVPAA